MSKDGLSDMEENNEDTNSNLSAQSKVYSDPNSTNNSKNLPSLNSNKFVQSKSRSKQKDVNTIIEEKRTKLKVIRKKSILNKIKTKKQAYKFLVRNKQCVPEYQKFKLSKYKWFAAFLAGKKSKLFYYR